MDARSRPYVGFVLERALGHVTHAENLKRLLPHEPAVEAEVFEVAWDTSGWPARVPGFNSNWTVRAGIRARRGIRRMHHERRLDSLFIHTQVPAVLVPDWLRRIPTVVSVDATPMQYDRLGEHYDHHPGNARVEALKWRASRVCFDRAVHIVSWSGWAKRGLIEDYGVDPAKISVIPPGVTPATWAPPSPRTAHDGPVRILFVGGDLQRKGGDSLLRAFRGLQTDHSANGQAYELELHLVTQSQVDAEPGVTVHRGLGPGSQALVELYQRADVFCLPTRGDCLPMVLSEAGAAGLPLISTAVAGIPEIVRDGETGLVVPPDDDAALAHALHSLVRAPELRHRLGAAARALVEREFDAQKNTHRLVELLTATAARGKEDAWRPHPTSSLPRPPTT
jgi:glycosyltransferase involved in cell wall biosynthesis